MIRTDDAPRRLRAVWLGPKGLRWPMDWTYIQWCVFAVLLVVFPALVFALLLLLSPAIAAWMAILGGPLLAYEVTKRMPTWIDYDRPLRYWVRTLRQEYAASTPMTRLQPRGLRVDAPSATALTRHATYELYSASTRMSRGGDINEDQAATATRAR
jgi:hypothetical protein